MTNSDLIGIEVGDFAGNGGQIKEKIQSLVRHFVADCGFTSIDQKSSQDYNWPHFAKTIQEVVGEDVSIGRIKDCENK
ncbi:hypothetical protein BKI52_03425 [marine bacterium AO1-C]|nr:hypothetical protein BKI52_03425 [marine bacterium AO1-C]